MGVRMWNASARRFFGIAKPSMKPCALMRHVYLKYLWIWGSACDVNLWNDKSQMKTHGNHEVGKRTVKSIQPWSSFRLFGVWTRRCSPLKTTVKKSCNYRSLKARQPGIPDWFLNRKINMRCRRNKTKGFNNNMTLRFNNNMILRFKKPFWTQAKPLQRSELWYSLLKARTEIWYSSPLKSKHWFGTTSSERNFVSIIKHQLWKLPSKLVVTRYRKGTPLRPGLEFPKRCKYLGRHREGRESFASHPWRLCTWIFAGHLRCVRQLRVWGDRSARKCERERAWKRIRRTRRQRLWEHLGYGVCGCEKWCPAWNIEGSQSEAPWCTSQRCPKANAYAKQSGPDRWEWSSRRTEARVWKACLQK